MFKIIQIDRYHFNNVREKTNKKQYFRSTLILKLGESFFFPPFYFEFSVYKHPLTKLKEEKTINRGFFFSFPSTELVYIFRPNLIRGRKQQQKKKKGND